VTGIPEGPRARPFVHVNCAISVDGRLAFAAGRRALLSGPSDLRRVQRLRADLDAILVGVGTVIADDPSLRVHWDLLDENPGSGPLRVVVDSRGRTPPTAKVLDGSQPTLVATAVDCGRAFPEGVEVLRTGQGHVELPDLLSRLPERGVRSVLVEGGARILASVVTGRLFDVLTVFVAPVIIGGPTAPPMVAVGEDPAGGPMSRLLLRRSQPMDGGVLLEYVPA
jgi:2,5-diamino-6-(ribosylamino)-4(3H)-pyrimidinone 5'-phosphate reductase